jgi:hypothetical protein
VVFAAATIRAINAGFVWKFAASMVSKTAAEAERLNPFEQSKGQMLELALTERLDYIS